MTFSVQINNLSEVHRVAISQVMANFNIIAGDMVEGEPIVIDFNKLPDREAVARYTSEIIAASMALYTMTKV